ncbi:unnamed protein product, partial [marine sediment metagenome]
MRIKNKKLVIKKSKNEDHSHKRFDQWKDKVRHEIHKRLEIEGKNSIIFKFFLSPLILMIGIVFLFLFLETRIFYVTGGFMIAYFF